MPLSAEQPGLTPILTGEFNDQVAGVIGSLLPHPKEWYDPFTISRTPPPTNTVFALQLWSLASYEGGLVGLVTEQLDESIPESQQFLRLLEKRYQQLKQQWHKDNVPRLSVREYPDTGIYYLEAVNCGENGGGLDPMTAWLTAIIIMMSNVDLSRCCITLLPQHGEFILQPPQPPQEGQESRVTGVAIVSANAITTNYRQSPWPLLVCATPSTK